MSITLGIADDNKDFCEILKDYFETQEKIKILFVVHDGLSAVDSVVKHQPDILILDMVMPHLDGLGVPQGHHPLCRRAGRRDPKSHQPGRRLLCGQTL